MEVTFLKIVRSTLSKHDPRKPRSEKERKKVKRSLSAGTVGPSKPRQSKEKKDTTEPLYLLSFENE